MGTFAVVNAYIKQAMLILMPVAGIMLVFYSGYQLWKDLRGAERKKIRERLREDASRKKAKKAELSITKQKAEQSIFAQILGKISITKKLEQWIQQANLNLEATQFLMWIGAAMMIFLVGGLLLKMSIAVIIAIVVSTGFLPIVVVKFLAKRRMNILVNQLPDVFELITQALRAGHSLASGIQLVGQQLPDPAGTEFARVFYEQNLGIKIEEALSNFADRTDQLDIRFFVTAVLIQRQTGGDLAEVLDKIGAVIRDRIQILGQVKALTAEGRLSGWVLAIMPFFVFFLAWMMNPDYAGVLLYEQRGHYLLGGALFFEIVGLLMIKKIVNIKV